MSMTKGAEPREGFKLKVQQAVYVPSTNKQQKFVGGSAFAKRVEITRKKLNATFGGSTSINGVGSFTDRKGNIIKEPVMKIESYSVTTDFKKKQKKFIAWIKQKRKKWGQESIGYEVETDLTFIE